jgi:16S rRNA (adenine1518-N6/adenine1519-N6)-dimethyltransferase
VPIRRRFGQHFLFDPRILERIAAALDPTPEDVVVEIGPGPGGLTPALIERTPHVLAIEKDRDLVPELRHRFPRATVIEGDALEQDWHALAQTAGAPGRYLVAGNIPYNVTSPLLDRALTSPLPDRVVFLVQKEVGDRLTAAPGSGTYGALTVGVQAVMRAERLFQVPAGAFRPPPKVDSVVVRLTPLPAPLLPARRRSEFRALVVGLFGFRRKQLQRGLRELTGRPPEWVSAVLASAEIDPTARPETLSPADFTRLLAAVIDGGSGGG